MSNDGKNKIEVKQVNPKLRLLLLIFSNWIFTILLILFTGEWASLAVRLPFFLKHEILFWILFGCYASLFFLTQYVTTSIGIKYLPEDLWEHYRQKNRQQLKKIKNLEIVNVTQLFNTTPICNKIYSNGLSWIEESNNRLVVNGKINNLDFSWGIVTKMKKNNFKCFMLTILYFAPILGIIFGLLMPIILNSNDWSERSQKKWFSKTKYKKLGCFDLVAKNIGEINSENYLIFAAKLKKRIDTITLIPDANKYQWPANLSERQKAELETLMATMPFSPSIYLYQDTISIVMKKYHYNAKDNNELQTWELLKQENSNNETHFNYLNNAIKIYQIFN